MNFETTNELIKTIKPYTENANITASSENEKFGDKSVNFDFVTIDENNNVCFQVFDEEIIVFYFTDHCHFEDYSSDSEDEIEDYLERAKKFLISLFENQIKYVEIHKGKKLSTEKYFIVYPDKTEERVGGVWWGLARFINPFSRKTVKTTFYKFDKSEGCFVKI